MTFDTCYFEADQGGSLSPTVSPTTKKNNHICACLWVDLIAHWLVLSQKFLIHTDASYSLSQGFWDVLQWLQKAELWVLVWVQLSSNVKIKKYKALITLHASGLLHGPMPRSSLLHITNLTFSAMCYRGKLHIIFRDVKLRPHHDFPVVENIDWQTKLTFQQVAQWLYLLIDM